MLDWAAEGWDVNLPPHRLLLLVPAACMLGLAGGQASGNLPGQPRVSIEPRPKTRASRAGAGAADIRVDSLLVLIPVLVTDPLNRFVPGLRKENFRVFEDKAEQQVTYFASEDAPVSIGLVFDSSGSMAAKTETARRAAVRFLETSNPGDEFFLVQFSDRPELVLPFTTNTNDIQARLSFTGATGRTALLDAIVMAIDYSKGHAARQRKALLVLSDGGDNNSRYTERQVRSMVREADVQIYAMGIFDPNRGPGPEDLFGPTLLTDIAQTTGGRYFRVRNFNDLPEVAARIGTELRNEYLLGFRPADTERNGKYRRVRVKIRAPPGLPHLRATWRPGYYFPAR